MVHSISNFHIERRIQSVKDFTPATESNDEKQDPCHD